MISKIFKVIWIISLMVTTVVFVYTYATLQDVVNMGERGILFSKEVFFYGSLAFLAVFNTFSFIMPRLLKTEFFISWFYGLIASLHLFFCSSFIFLAIVNSNEKYDFSKIGPTVIGSFVLLIGWIAALPILTLSRRLSGGNQVL